MNRDTAGEQDKATARDDASRREEVEAVLFDYGLVLTGPPDPAAWEEMKGVLGVEEQGFQAAYWRYRHDYDRGTLRGDQYWRAVADDLECQVAEPQVHLLQEADVLLWTRPNTPMIEWAAALQAAGVRTGILSNLGDAMEAGVMRSLRWMEAFDHHTFSHRLRIAKPEAAIYRHAAEGLRTAPASVLFIDDREENVGAARAAGMQALQYRSHAEFLEEFARLGYAKQLPAPGLG